MPDVQKISVALTAEHIAALRTAVETGEYATTSEIIREALRDWQRKREMHAEDVKRLRQLWDEGMASGPATNLDLSDVLEEARRRLEHATRVARAG